MKVVLEVLFIDLVQYFFLGFTMIGNRLVAFILSALLGLEIGTIIALLSANNVNL